MTDCIPPTNVPIKYYILVDCKPLEIKEGDMLTCNTKSNGVTDFKVTRKYLNKRNMYVNYNIYRFNTLSDHIIFNTRNKGGKSRTIHRFREKRKNKSIKINK
jgi:hypothetical protein